MSQVSKGIYQTTEMKAGVKLKNGSESKLLEPVKIGAWNLQTRTAMDPMTRCFADDPTGVIGDDVVEYYRKRAADRIGLIISEGIVVSPRGKGNPEIPGLYSEEQIEGWIKSNGCCA
jgi:N-ethylmaleimide reductase